ncbi:hypothetical protein CCR84_08260 [Rhodocyclus purpureus]|nr:hypothetical protein [Rhodocyclus purpureus]
MNRGWATVSQERTGDGARANCLKDVTDDIRSRMRGATVEQLELWADRILDAQTLSEVFQEH